MIHRFREINSTNQYALDNYKELVHADVILADIQTEGRGRNRKKWLSGDGNLYMTLFLKLTEAEPRVFMTIPQYTGFIILRVLKKYGIEAQLKWPNDILVGDKKLAGILAESNTDKIMVVGIGMNLNLNKQQLLSVGRPAVSLKQLGLDIEKNYLAELITDEFFKDLDQYLLKGFSSIYNEYRVACLYIGQEIIVKYPDKEIKGVFSEVNRDGSISLMVEDKQFNIFSGELSLSYENS